MPPEIKKNAAESTTPIVIVALMIKLDSLTVPLLKLSSNVTQSKGNNTNNT